MAFSTYEELMAAVESRRASVLTLEVDLGGAFSQEHEDAKHNLAQARVMKQVVGGSFLGETDLSELEREVELTRPAPNSVWVQYRKLDLNEWALLTKQAGLSPVEQYEKVLPKTFIAVYGSDPVRPDDLPEDAFWEAPAPLSTDGALLSSRGSQGILPGGGLHQVVQTFMAWQNSGGDVSIRPTRSGLV